MTLGGNSSYFKIFNLKALLKIKDIFTINLKTRNGYTVKKK